MEDRYMTTLWNSYAANWLSFCPNLIAETTPDIRLSIFYYGLLRAKYLNDITDLSPDELYMANVDRDNAFKDFIPTLVGDVSKLRNGVTGVYFQNEEGIGRGVFAAWRALVSGQIFGSTDGGMFETSRLDKILFSKFWIRPGGE
jgi:hypothetical protein